MLIRRLCEPSYPVRLDLPQPAHGPYDHIHLLLRKYSIVLYTISAISVYVQCSAVQCIVVYYTHNALQC